MTLSVRTISSILLSKIYVNWFYKFNENSITDSNQEPIGSCPNLNHKILFFSASLPSLKAIQRERKKNSPLSRRNFRELNSLKFFRSYTVSFLCYIRKICQSVPGCSGRTDSTGVLALGKRLAPM